MRNFIIALLILIVYYTIKLLLTYDVNFVKKSRNDSGKKSKVAIEFWSDLKLLKEEMSKGLTGSDKHRPLGSAVGLEARNTATGIPSCIEMR